MTWPTWEDMQASFSANVDAAYDASIGRAEAVMVAKTAEVEAYMRKYLTHLNRVRLNLLRIQKSLPAVPKTQQEANAIGRYAQMKSLYDTLLQGITDNSELVTQPEAGNPVVVVVAIAGLGVLAMSVAAVAWAFATMDYAEHADHASTQWVQYLDKEQAARVEAMRTGKTLQGYTGGPAPAPGPGPGGPPDPPGGKGSGAVWWLIGLGAAAAGATYLYSRMR